MSTKTILIVDDSPIVRTELSDSLSEKGYKTIEAEDGLAGLKAYKENEEQINLVICDVNMPNMNGLKMCAKIKEDESLTKSISILMLTTEMDASMKEEGKANGVIAWLTKPCKSEKLLAVIEKIWTKYPGT